MLFSRLMTAWVGCRICLSRTAHTWQNWQQSLKSPEPTRCVMFNESLQAWMYSLPCVMPSFGSKSATKDLKNLLCMLKGNRAEGQPTSRKGISPSSLCCCQAQVAHQLAGQLAQQISTSWTAECHEGTPHNSLFSCHMHCALVYRLNCRMPS